MLFKLIIYLQVQKLEGTKVGPSNGEELLFNKLPNEYIKKLTLHLNVNYLIRQVCLFMSVCVSDVNNL